MMTADISPVAIGPGFADNVVLVKGEGRPVVYLHGLLGQEWPEFTERLSQGFKVYAPAHAGSVDQNDLLLLDGFPDLLLYYDDLFNRLGLDGFDLVGHSFGGAVAAEYAATFNHRVRRLVLIDAMGLWDDEHPVPDHLLAPEDRRRGLLFHDLDNPAVQARLAPPATQEEMVEALLGNMRALASTSHFFHPIPDRGLARRLHRITANTLVVWGEQDQLTPLHYGHRFASSLRRGRLETIADAGHSPHIEQANTVAKLVSDFLF